MSLFKWSTPERQRVDRILPIIPNEIYLHIFEHIAPPTGYLTPEQLRVFVNLSRVCRFFANFCLPRIFEFVEFSGSIFRDDTPGIGLRKDAIYNTSRGTALCRQIAAKRPLAFALAKTVRVCHFTGWKLDETGSWAVRLFANKYISGMVHMENIRELRFTNSYVDTEHWNAVATLASLDQLSFDLCQFLQGPADVEPEKRVRIRVPRLRVTDCSGNRQPIAAIDVRYLRSLAVDFTFSQKVDWLSQSALTELQLCPQQFLNSPQDSYIEQLHSLLMRAPRSLQTLVLSVDFPHQLIECVVRNVFDDSVRKNLPLLRSLTLRIHYLDINTPAAKLSSALEGIDLLTGLRSFILEDYSVAPEISHTEIRRILLDKLGRPSNLKHVDIYGHVLRLVDGEWLNMSSSAT